MRAYRPIFFQILALVLYSIFLSISVNVLIPGPSVIKPAFFVVGFLAMVVLLNKAK